ncbi:uncharacterized protein LOC119191113 isoform X2 [Manduca sexta]|uniref:uncharacterized protein LOC119191113 isoform X2 n=1 Tax=Manduca sexta TaxID=7130 RepID=UPI00188E53FD|nr:uncharacterized protein LOC119191113 isoform X2 [Manduca sexta]
MDKCGICLKPAVLFETGKDGVYACFKCQPLVPEVSIGENSCDQPERTPPTVKRRVVSPHCTVVYATNHSRKMFSCRTTCGITVPSDALSAPTAIKHFLNLTT